MVKCVEYDLGVVNIMNYVYCTVPYINIFIYIKMKVWVNEIKINV